VRLATVLVDRVFYTSLFEPLSALATAIVHYGVTEQTDVIAHIARGLRSTPYLVETQVGLLVDKLRDLGRPGPQRPPGEDERQLLLSPSFGRAVLEVLASEQVRQRAASARARRQAVQEAESGRTALAEMLCPEMRWEAYLTLLARVRARELMGEEAAGPLGEMSPPAFEQLVATLLRDRGYREVVVSGGPGDRGADIEALDASGRRVIAQCKYYTAANRVSSQDMYVFVGMVVHHDAARGVYAANGGFTAEAERIAAAHDIELLDRDAIVKLIASRQSRGRGDPRESLIRVVREEIRREQESKLEIGTVTRKHQIGDEAAWILNMVDSKRDACLEQRTMPETASIGVTDLTGVSIRVGVISDPGKDSMLHTSRALVPSRERADDILKWFATLRSGDVLTARVCKVNDDAAHCWLPHNAHGYVGLGMMGDDQAVRAAEVVSAGETVTVYAYYALPEVLTLVVGLVPPPDVGENVVGDERSDYWSVVGDAGRGPLRGGPQS
jgi:Restriction endonuclease